MSIAPEQCVFTLFEKNLKIQPFLNCLRRFNIQVDKEFLNREQ